jgi:hypothetical protein
MSHFALRVGHFLLSHPPAFVQLGLLGTLRKSIPVATWRRGESSADERDDLAYLGLCVRFEEEDPYTELDRMSLTTSKDSASPWGQDETWLSLL